MKLRGIKATEVVCVAGSPHDGRQVEVQVDMTTAQVCQAICVLLGSLPQEEASRFLRSEFEELFDEQEVKK